MASLFIQQFALGTNNGVFFFFHHPVAVKEKGGQNEQKESFWSQEYGVCCLDAAKSFLIKKLSYE